MRAEAGRVIGLLGPPGGGMTRLGLALMAEPSRRSMVGLVDVRGWASPTAAWEVGVDPDHLVVVRTPDRYLWLQVVAALLEGLPAVYAELPSGVADPQIHRLAALARARRSALLLRPLDGRLPSGVSYLNLQSERVMWEGVTAGHGRLSGRRLRIRAWGKAVGGIEQMIEVEDDGTDALRVVAGLASAPAGRAVG